MEATPHLQDKIRKGRGPFMKEALLAIDVGSTSIKAMAFDTSGHELASGRCATPVEKTPEGLSYSTQVLWDAVKTALCELMKELGKTDAYPAAIAVTGYGNDGVPLDKDDRELYPFISWRCTRFYPQFEKTMQEFGHRRIFDCTGVQARPVDVVHKLMWLNDNHPEVLAGTSSFLMMQDYINFRLTGEKATDPTVVFTTSMFDPLTEGWSKDIADYAGIDTGIFAEVKHSGEPVGKVTKAAAAETGLPEGLPVILGGWDIECASFSTGTFRKGSLMDILGSWETLMVSADQYIRNDAVYHMGLHACNHVAKGMYSYPVFFVSSAVVEWFLDTIFSPDMSSDDRYDRFIQEIEQNSRPLSGGTLFLPHLFGAITPVADSRSRGLYMGLTSQTTRADMGRATLEGLGFMCRQVHRGIEQFLNGNIEEIVFCGGGSKNRLWCQIKADIAGCDAMIENQADTTALGAALKAGIGAGIYRDDEEAVRAAASDRVPLFHDPENAKLYEKAFEVFDQLYSTIKPLNEKVYEMNH